ncbi:MAG: peptide-methionine (S)-S-oxide reductase MsrA [Candidatus Hodarchaeales archaeon]
MNDQTNEMTATLGGGCFWCLEAVYEMVKGVASVTSGYSGGSIENPTYGEVCSGETGHAEVVRIVYRPCIISFKELLEIFFAIHDPTQLDRQGNDVGTQYRSVIFYHSPLQKEIAEKTINELNESGVLTKPVVTRITPLKKFYPAGNHHQNYYRDNSHQPYCRFVISPKISHFTEKYPSKLKDSSLDEEKRKTILQ